MAQPNDTTGFDLEHGFEEYTDAELLEQAQANAQAIILASLAFLEQAGVSPAAWARSVGASLERAWGEPRPWDAGEFLDAMLTNYRALGAVVHEANLAPKRATATFSGVLSPELAELLGVAPETAAAFHGIGERIAGPRGLKWSARGDARLTHVTVERAGA